VSGAPGPLAGGAPLIDVHAHFYHDGCGRAHWRELNAARLDAGRRIGITVHVGSVLGSWGRTSPVYFASPDDLRAGNDAMLAFGREHADLVRSYVHVNPNEGAGALRELERGAAAGAIGLKLAAARRADDALLDDLAAEAGRRHMPVLHHIWQHRRRHWPSQDISDGTDLVRLAARHPDATFILAHIGGGGDWAHSCAALRDVPNVVVDLSGSGIDRGMLDDVVESVGASRMVWGADVTLETGLAKLWALDELHLAPDDLEAIRWRNAERLFPDGAFPALVSGVAVTP
jgi:predicted TIM-barrel fold metal-dependent hydrolase